MINEIELPKHRLPMWHPSGLRAEIVQDPYDERWQLPGGKRYALLSAAIHDAVPMFKAAGWTLLEVRK